MIEALIQILIVHLFFGLAAGLAWSQLPSNSAVMCWVILGLGYLLWRKLDQVHTAMAEERRAEKLAQEGRWVLKGFTGLLALGAGGAVGAYAVGVAARESFWTELVEGHARRVETAENQVRDAVRQTQERWTRGQAELMAGLLKIEELERDEVRVLEGLGAKLDSTEDRDRALERLNASLQSLEQTQRRLHETMDRLAARLSEGK